MQWEYRIDFIPVFGKEMGDNIIFIYKGKKDWDNFVARMEHHFERSDQAAINYARSAYDPVVRAFMQDDQLMVEMSTWLLNPISIR